MLDALIEKIKDIHEAALLIDRDVSVCYVWKSRFKVKTLADLPGAGNLNFGLTSPGSASYFNQSMLKGVFAKNAA